MEIQQLKILLKLLGQNKYQEKIADIKPNSQTKIEATQKLCYELYNKELIEIEERVIAIKANKKNKQLLNSNKKQDILEEKILKQCDDKNIKISDIKISPASKRDLLIEKLVKENLINISDKKITHVELTEKGQQFLAEEYLTEGLGNITLTKPLLNNYLTFIRNYYITENQEKISSTKDIIPEVKEENINQNKQINKKITPDDILQTIIELDHTFNTDNYLPIFYLRNQYKSVLQRHELDSMIFGLQKENKISLSRLVDASQYTAEEYDAGIPQSIGYPIFYLIVK